MATLLIIEDDMVFQRALKRALEPAGHNVSTADTGHSGLAMLEEHMPDVVLLDLVLEDGDLDGLEVLARIRALNSELPIIIMTGHACVETAVEAMKLGASDYVQKPLNIDEVLLLIDRSLEVVNLRRELDRLRSAQVAPVGATLAHVVEEHDEGSVYDGVVRQLLIEALQRTRGKKAQACRWLGLSKSRLDYRLRQYGISATEIRKAGE